MSMDPNQPQGQPPSGPNPYDPQPTPPPLQNPYEPTQNPYAQAPNMEFPGAQPYAYPVQAAPLPLGQAIQGLPSQYIKVLTKPGAQSFAEEQSKADWGIIWIQLLFVGLVGTIVGVIRFALGTALVMGTNGGSSASVALISGLFGGSASIFAIISTIIGFFIIVGIQYLLAKAFGGEGSFVQQGYDYLLFYAPISVVGALLGWIPILGLLIGIGLGIYQIILNVFSIMASHRLSGGKATAVVLIPIAAIILLVFLCVFAIVAIFFAAAHGSGH